MEGPFKFFGLYQKCFFANHEKTITMAHLVQDLPLMLDTYFEATLTEESYDGMSVKSIADVLDVLDEKLDLSEMEGKIFEEEMLSIIEQSEVLFFFSKNLPRVELLLHFSCLLARSRRADLTQSSLFWINHA